MRNNYCILVSFITAFSFGISFSHGQDYGQKVEVRLKNTSIIKGYITDSLTDGSIRIAVSDQTELAIDSADISEVAFIKGKGDDRYKTFSNRHLIKSEIDPGLYHQLFAGLSIGEDEFNGSLGIINGYRINKNLAIGLGLNYDRYDQISTLPIYLQPKWYVRNEKSSLYYFIDLGYSIGWENDESTAMNENREVKGGLMGQAGVGYQVNFSKSALHFTLGYKLQKAVIRNEYYDYYPHYSSRWDPADAQKTMEVEEKSLFRKFVFTVGFSL